VIVGSLERVAVQFLFLLTLPVVLSLRIEVDELQKDCLNDMRGVGQVALLAGTASPAVADDALLIPAQSQIRAHIAVAVVLEDDNLTMFCRRVEDAKMRRVPTRVYSHRHLDVSENAVVRVIDGLHQLNDVLLEDDTLHPDPSFVLVDPVKRGVVPPRPHPDRPVPRYADVDAVWVTMTVRYRRVTCVETAPIVT